MICFLSKVPFIGKRIKIARFSEGGPVGARTPFCCDDWGICCDGTMFRGWCIADIVDDALGPDENAGTA